MTVAELIAKLLEMNQAATVYVDSDGSPTEPQHVEYDTEDTDVVIW